MIAPQSGNGIIRIAAVIPLYNNASAVSDVIAGVYNTVGDIFVVDDGSTDGSVDVVRSVISVLPDASIRLIEFSHNCGKGAALRSGLKAALECGFTNAIAIDADGQHCPEDIIRFVEKIRVSPDVLWIGDRVLPYRGSVQPLRSRAGRSFGAFWYRFFTDRNIRDTQCGFRAYPIKRILDLDCFGNRYEYEQEVLIRAAWSGILVESVPVHLYYPPRGRAVSHFRPVVDFIRIAKVNSKAAFIKIFTPWRAVGISGRGWRHNLMFLLSNASSPHNAALSLAMGVFFGILPVYGFQVILLTALTPILHLNWPLAFLGVNVSFAPVLPFLIAAGVAVGKVVVPLVPLRLPQGVWSHSIAKGGMEWFAGSIVLAIVSALLIYGISYLFFSRRKK